VQVFVFDFGTEMYVWTGKHVPFNRRKRALRLAVELWDAGYDYVGHDINPLCPLIGTKKLVRTTSWFCIAALNWAALRHTTLKSAQCR